MTYLKGAVPQTAELLSARKAGVRPYIFPSSFFLLDRVMEEEGKEEEGDGHVHRGTRNLKLATNADFQKRISHVRSGSDTTGALLFYDHEIMMPSKFNADPNLMSLDFAFLVGEARWSVYLPSLRWISHPLTHTTSGPSPSFTPEGVRRKNANFPHVKLPSLQ